MRNDRTRIVVTGMGVVTTIGQDLHEYRTSLVSGQSGISRWSGADDRGYARITGDMSDFDLGDHLRRVGVSYPADTVQRARRLLRATPLSGRLTAAAALQGFLNAGLPDFGLDPERIGHVLAGTNLNCGYIRDNATTYVEEPDFIDPLFGVMFLDTDVLSVTSELLNLRGPTFTIGNACASGNMAVIAAIDLMRADRADAVIVSGGSFDLDPLILHGWALIDALSVTSFNNEPWRASRPFDARREGFVPSAGAAALVLERLDGAVRRRAPIWAEILGAACASDATRLTKPNLDGQVRVMREALGAAHVLPHDVDYINAHATSTPLGDAVEVAAIKRVFGDHAYRIPINSTKSLLGHCLAAAGVVELVATMLQMRHDFVHPTINQETADPELDLDFVPNVAREHRTNVALSNSFGFGGLNASVVVGKVS